VWRVTSNGCACCESQQLSINVSLGVVCIPWGSPDAPCFLHRRRSFLAAKRASLEGLRVHSAHEDLGFTESFGLCEAYPVRSGGRPADVFRRLSLGSRGSDASSHFMFRRSSLGSRGSDASLHFMDVPPAESVPAARRCGPHNKCNDHACTVTMLRTGWQFELQMRKASSIAHDRPWSVRALDSFEWVFKECALSMCSSAQRHHLSDRYYARVPRSVKRRSLSVLPDAVVPDIESETDGRAFAEQVGDTYCMPLLFDH
jgi:hypothetical protein